jgi:hypothetical protein
MSEQLQLGAGEERTGRSACATWQRWAELDELVAKALRASLLTEREKEILRVIAGHKGAARAIRSEDVAAAAGMEWCEKTRREIAGVVETAVLLHKIPIGGSRAKPCGYFVIVNANDLELAITPLWGEVYALLRRLRALTGKQLVARMFGQAMLKLDAEEPKEAA